jgi:preprotein translocase subunit SecE
MAKYYNLSKQEALALGLAVLLSLAIFGAFIWAMIELFGNVIKLI